MVPMRLTSAAAFASAIALVGCSNDSHPGDGDMGGAPMIEGTGGQATTSGGDAGTTGGAAAGGLSASDGGHAGKATGGAATGGVATGGHSLGGGSGGLGGSWNDSQTCTSGTYDHDGEADTPCVPWSTCEPGSYVSFGGSGMNDRICRPCEVGTFSDAANATNCNHCEAGHVSYRAGAVECEPCPGGTISVTTSECELCPAGFYSDPGSSTCRACQDGTFAPDLGSPKCEVCSPGTSPHGTGLAECPACPAGTYRTADLSYCTPCPQGTYAPEAGAASCAPRPVCDWEESVVTPSTSTSAPKCAAGGTRYRQFGTSTYDELFAIAVTSAGDVFVGGQTYGTLPNLSSYGGSDSILLRYDSGGNAIWTAQLGNLDSQLVRTLAVDADGGLYYGGEDIDDTNYHSESYYSVMLEKQDVPGGTIAWQHGTAGIDLASARDIQVDANNNVYLAGWASVDGSGYTSFFVRKIGQKGGQIWNQALAMWPQAVALDEQGNIYVGGRTGGVAVSKLTTQGAPIWDLNYGSSSNFAAKDIVVLGDSIFVLGEHYAGTEPSLEDEIYLYKLDANGVQRDVFTFGTAGFDIGNQMVADGEGNLAIIGSTTGSFLGFTNAGLKDAVFLRVGPTGELLEVDQFGTAQDDSGNAIALGPNGRLFAAGGTRAALPGNLHRGSTDGFVVRL
jgi:hypothetical protein